MSLKEPILTPVRKPSLSIVIMGDSNTEGYGLETGESYTDHLNRLLKGQATFYNRGVSGTCVIQKRLSGAWVGMPYVNETAYQSALALKGDVYLINLGTNDATDGEDDVTDAIDPYGNLMAYEEQFAEDYNCIIEAIHTSNANAKIVVCIPIPIRKSIWKKHKQIYLERLADEIRTIAAKKHIDCIDLMQPLLQMDALDRLYQSDGLHLNAIGAAHVGNIILKELIHCGVISDTFIS